MKECGIYGLLNVITGKWYVGQSIDMQSRIRHHLADLRAQRHDNQRLQYSFNKHGPGSFQGRVIEHTAEDVLDERERFHIIALRSRDDAFGYNLQTGGQDYHRHSPETLARMCIAQKGHVVSAETRLLMSLKYKGRKLSPETRLRMSIARKGKPRAKPVRRKPLSEETKRKIAVSHIGIRPNAESRQKMSISARNRRQREALAVAA